VNGKPSAFRAHVEVNGDAQAAYFIRQIGYRAAHTLPLMTKLVDVLQLQQKRRMEQKPWAPLEASTVARKISESENPDTFRDEARRIKGQPTRMPDALYRAITQPNFPGQLRHVTRASATFGVKSAGQGPFFYARFVQNVKGKKRRILALTPDDALILTGFVEFYIMGDPAAEKWQAGRFGKG
jgi:hypothetical protein